MTKPILDDLPARTEEAARAGEALFDAAAEGVRALAGGAKDADQHELHGLAWLKVYVESLCQMRDWARALDGDGRLGETERLILQLAYSEYLAQIVGGIPMSQGEIIRLGQMNVSHETIQRFTKGTVAELIERGASREAKARLAALLAEHEGAASFGDTGLGETDEMIRGQFRRYAEEKVVPFAHGWHLRDELIPLEVISDLAALGVFGLTIPEDFGGSGLGKVAMCVVTEELARGWIGVGSLATRTEIAAELILTGGTEEQKRHWLPRLGRGEILPTAVFTEPNTGSDLGALRTRAVKSEDGNYFVSGNKTWITHGGRTDLMTLLARTDTNEPGYKGLTMFLAEKPRGTAGEPFPHPAMSGGEIEVLGYRGMKEYEIAFDGFPVKAENALGGVEGQGFKQLMATFESARIQTAARAVGVAQNALDLGLRYALERVQFGRQLIEFPRVANKLVAMAVELMVARQLTYYAARAKDGGRRCDLEAGLAKLLAARVAWAAADNAVQIHGGNGFALEYPVSRVLCDARLLNIFEGAGEIQAQVIARRLLDGEGLRRAG